MSIETDLSRIASALERIAAKFEGQAPLPLAETAAQEVKTREPKAETPKAEPKAETPKAETPKAEPKAETPKAETPATPRASRGDLMSLAQKLIAKGKAPQAKAILAAGGWQMISDIPTEKLAEVKAAFEGLLK